MPSPAVTLLGGRWLTAARRVGAPPLQDRSPPVLCDGCLGAGARLVRAPSCASPACGLDPRTSVWRSADPPCSGAACRSGSPAAAPVPLGFQTTVTSMLLHPAQSASPFECPKPCPPPGKTDPLTGRSTSVLRSWPYRRMQAPSRRTLVDRCLER